jgi:hypothetical protein
MPNGYFGPERVARADSRLHVEALLRCAHHAAALVRRRGLCPQDRGQQFQVARAKLPPQVVLHRLFADAHQIVISVPPSKALVMPVAFTLTAVTAL